LILVEWYSISRSLYIGKYPPSRGEKYQPMSFGEKYETGKRKMGKCKRKRKKGEEKEKM
jgi:hypothetical protein